MDDTRSHSTISNTMVPSDESATADITADDTIFDDSEDKMETGKVDVSKEETRMVNQSRCVFVVFLGAAAVSMGLLTYRVSKTVEDLDFQTRVIEVSQINAMNIFQYYKTTGKQLTAFSLDTGKKWPFVQMPRFEAQTMAAKTLTGASYISYSPVVEEFERESYEEFALKNRNWIQESIDFLDQDTNISDLALSPTIFALGNSTFEDKGLPFYLPVAQMSSPAIYPHAINADVATDDNMDRAFQIMNATRNAVMSGFKFPSNPNLSVGSHLATPVFENFDNSSKIVAVFSGYLRWGKNFENLLPAGAEPLVLVVDNCEDSISFEIRGPKVTYLGRGDHFGDNYDMVRIGQFAPYEGSTGCDFTLRVYQTLAFEKTYRTNAPLIHTIVVVSVVVVTALLFGWYNLVVEYRQKRLAINAKKNSTIVESLFPETVRDRLVEYVPSSYEQSLSGSDTVSSIGPPIADKFQSATVFFADMVGFTKWSSTRDANQVFVLFETIYNAFDWVARRMGVFKTETIGDCYMAVTGLPKVREDHAIVMVQFARACLMRMYQILPQLEEALGEGTAELSLRIGIHSGSVTAGVLRGSKRLFFFIRWKKVLFGIERIFESLLPPQGRLVCFLVLVDFLRLGFQASRMESNGQPGRIHISSVTAQHLTDHGKSDWLLPREDVVIAKGKGAMKTFWVHRDDDDLDSQEHAMSYQSKWLDVPQDKNP